MMSLVRSYNIDLPVVVVGCLGENNKSSGYKKEILKRGYLDHE